MRTAAGDSFPKLVVPEGLKSAPGVTAPGATLGLQNTLIEINWVKLILSTEPVKFYLPDVLGSQCLSSHRPHINLIDSMGQILLNLCSFFGKER